MLLGKRRVIALEPGACCTASREVVQTMVDDAALREKMQVELDKLGLTGEVAEQLVRELNFLACLLIEAAREGRSDGRTT